MEQITGKVEKGVQRGRLLAFPTINFKAETIESPDGIYISEALVGDVWRPSVSFVGNPITFGDPNWRVETYIMDFHKNLYGQTVTIKLHKKIRNNQMFDYVEDLIQAMADDVAQARQYFAGKDN